MDDASEFDEIFTGMLPRLYSRVTALVGSRALADDVVQEVYLRLRATGRRTRRFIGHPTPYGYALTTAVNLARAHWRSQRRELLLDDFPAASYDGGMAEAEARYDLTWLLATLTAKEAATIVLVDLDGLTLDEVATLLGVHKGTAQRNRMRALGKLRERLTHPSFQEGTRR
ncbi:hypothetical protein ADK67_27680 [Saccharothrix sp. NRRL B-16348]|uniref:RNA polymerase sigma factor n=1 Tax=Saccharothrix sp. NRRL B-16348 TaxID=1415542 RepID=UPI0006AD8C56|nr:RNA polymerase sigma factor [Saccharothrix sp. NRRL B-16348]KOX21233.1 hypothetical protein ADK67_27680 [Saccharothrix sp. NRRL B-16348]